MQQLYSKAKIFESLQPPLIQNAQVKQYERLTLTTDPKLLKCRNYQVFNQQQDSIDIQDIIEGTYISSNNFEAEKMSHWLVPQDTSKYVFNNFNSQYPLQSKMDHQIKVNQTKQAEKDAESQSQSKEHSHRQQNKQAKQKRFKITRKQAYSFSMIEKLTVDFQKIQKKGDVGIPLQSLSQKYHIGHAAIVSLYKQWLEDPAMAKYLNRQEQPLGALIDGKRERTLQRLKIVKELLANNPYYSHKQISDKLFERNRSKKKVMRSAIIRIMKIEGYMRKKISQKPLKQQMDRIILHRLNYANQFRGRDKNSTNIYYLDEFLFHKYLYRDCFWTLQKKSTAPRHSDKFIAESFIMIALMCPNGTIYWQIRGGNYSEEEYTKLVGKIFKKIGNSKQNNLIIINKNSIRNIGLAIDLIQKEGFSYMQMPKRSQLLSPLQTLFLDIKNKVKRLMISMPDNAIKHLCDVVNAYSKDELGKFVSSSKQYMDLAQKKQYF